MEAEATDGLTVQASNRSSSGGDVTMGRRTANAFVLGLAASVTATATGPSLARADEGAGVTIVADKEGFGSKVAKAGDLVLVNYYGGAWA